MEQPFSTIVIIVIVVLMLLVIIYFSSKIKEYGASTLEQILNIPDFLKKIFGGG